MIKYQSLNIWTSYGGGGNGVVEIGNGENGGESTEEEEVSTSGLWGSSW